MSCHPYHHGPCADAWQLLVTWVLQMIAVHQLLRLDSLDSLDEGSLFLFFFFFLAGGCLSFFFFFFLGGGCLSFVAFFSFFFLALVSSFAAFACASFRFCLRMRILCRRAASCPCFSAMATSCISRALMVCLDSVSSFLRSQYRPSSLAM